MQTVATAAELTAAIDYLRAGERASDGAVVPDAPRIASATDKLIIHKLGLQVMRRENLNVADATFQFVGNHLNAAKAVLQGEADLGFVFNETWNGMNASTKSELQIVGESRDGTAFHCFMVAPEWADKREAIQGILCAMHQDPAGLRVLDDLHFADDASLDLLQALLGAPRPAAGARGGNPAGVEPPRWCLGTRPCCSTMPACTCRWGSPAWVQTQAQQETINGEEKHLL